jgi:hypothetical protein
MLNLFPKTHPSVSLLYGKRPLQRIVVGSKAQQVEIPMKFVEDLPEKLDTSASYVGNKFHALPWEDYIKIKLDARNLINANTKTALTGLSFYPKINALHAGQAALTSASVIQEVVSQGAAKVKYPVSDE